MDMRDKLKEGRERFQAEFERLASSAPDSPDHVAVKQLSTDYQLIIAKDPGKIMYGPVKSTMSAALAGVGLLVAGGLDLDRVLAELKRMLMQSGKTAWESFKRGDVPNNNGELIEAFIQALEPLIPGDQHIEIPTILREVYGRDPQTFKRLDGTADITLQSAIAETRGEAPSMAESAIDERLLKQAQAKFAKLGGKDTTAH